MLVALVYRLVILNLAFQILPTIGADSWETEVGVDDSWGDRPTSALAHLLLTYRQSIMIMVYSHLLCKFSLVIFGAASCDSDHAISFQCWITLRMFGGDG